MTNVNTSRSGQSTSPTPAVTTVLCDLDGVIWLARRAIPGAAEAVAALRSAGIRVLFVTNNSAARVVEQQHALAQIGIPAVDDVLTSAQAAATLVQPGERVMACADVGVSEALEAAGAIVVEAEGSPSVDAVVVGLHRHFDYLRLQSAATAIRSGARFIGTNDDATFPTPDGPIPGGGALVAAVAVAAGADPILAGKPHPPMAELVRRIVGDDFDPSTTVMVGDRASTDGAFAAHLGVRFALVRSGVTPPGSEPGSLPRPPWIDVTDFAAASLLIGAESKR